jgi:hypothetical protein
MSQLKLERRIAVCTYKKLGISSRALDRGVSLDSLAGGLASLLCGFSHWSGHFVVVYSRLVWTIW